MDNMIYWIWLSLSCRPSGNTFGKLIKEFGDAKEIYEADGKKVSSIIGYRNADRTALDNKSLEKAEEILAFCKKHKVGILIFNDELFPNALREIENPPVLLYYRGILPDFNKEFFVGAVGTRSISDYGRKNTFRICHDLATTGAVIVSGMAIGIDGVAMAGALSAGGKTVAVIGSGIDICYPPQHLGLAREIVKNGCVLTEYAPGVQPTKYSFPARNRIISGLSAATIVFEGPERSGALITARCAVEQKRKLYALPAGVGEKNSQLTTLLIKNGASVCTAAEDVIKDFTDTYRGIINPFLLKERLAVDMIESLRRYSVCAVCPGDDIFVPTKPQLNKEQESEKVADNEPEVSQPPESFDKLALKIYKRIPLSEPCELESLVDAETNLRDVMKCLLKLEVNGFIKMLPGEMVTRKFK